MFRDLHKPILNCPCCGRLLKKEDFGGWGIWAVELFDVNLFKKHNIISTRIYDVCDECFETFGNEILAYEDEDVANMQGFEWLKSEKVQDYIWGGVAEAGFFEAGFFMVKIPHRKGDF